MKNSQCDAIMMHGDSYIDAEEQIIVKAVTLRNIPVEIAKKIERKANKAHISINRAVIELLEDNFGIGRHNKEKTVHHDLDHLSGTWSRKEASRFEKTLLKSRKIDTEVWK